jgi:hypothetical protein
LHHLLLRARRAARRRSLERRERHRLEAHFARALSIVEARDTSMLDTSLREARAKNLERLRAYRARGLFPRNTDFPRGRAPYFVDRGGRACAVAHLVLADGRADVVHAVARAENNAYLRSMKTPALLEWASASGLMVEELAIIQPDYCPDTSDSCSTWTLVGNPVDPDSHCEYVVRPDGESCQSDFDPFTSSACSATEGICKGGHCEHANLPDGAPCQSSDNDVCTAAEGTCAEGVCVARPRDCDDGDPSTADTCDLFDGCRHLPQASSGCATASRIGGAAELAPLLLLMAAARRLQRHRARRARSAVAQASLPGGR